jgi:hypothetical protein
MWTAPTRTRGFWRSPPEAGRSWVPEEELGKGTPVDGHKVGDRGDEVVE